MGYRVPGIFYGIGNPIEKAPVFPVRTGIIKIAVVIMMCTFRLYAHPVPVIMAAAIAVVVGFKIFMRGKIPGRLVAGGWPVTVVSGLLMRLILFAKVYSGFRVPVCAIGPMAIMLVNILLRIRVLLLLPVLPAAPFVWPGMKVVAFVPAAMLVRPIGVTFPAGAVALIRISAVALVFG